MNEPIHLFQKIVDRTPPSVQPAPFRSRSATRGRLLLAADVTAPVTTPLLLSVERSAITAPTNR